MFAESAFVVCAIIAMIPFQLKATVCFANEGAASDLTQRSAVILLDFDGRLSGRLLLAVYEDWFA